jgi:hypothetical protein
LSKLLTNVFLDKKMSSSRQIGIAIAGYLTQVSFELILEIHKLTNGEHCLTV